MTDQKKKQDFVIDTNHSGGAPTINLQGARSNLMDLEQGMREAKKQADVDSKEEVPESKDSSKLEDVLLEEDNSMQPVIDLVAESMRKAQKTLLDPEIQAKVKAKCEPLSVEDMVKMGEFRQKVPIREDFYITFRSISAEEDLELKKIMSEVDFVSERHFTDLYSFYQQTVGIVSVNGNALPTHIDEGGKLDKDKLDEKIKYLLKMPIQMAQALSMHYYWFELRVRDMFDVKNVIGEIKNG